MANITAQNNRFYHVLEKLWTRGSLVKPRGLLCKELTNFQYYLEPRERFMCFDQRKFKLDYAKQEFLWYIRGDRKDISIAKIAGMWKDLVNSDGTINSNYGWYLFNNEATGTDISNFERIAQTLEGDPDSRRAAVMILSNEKLNSVTKDYPCTAYLNFQIRKNWLNIYVRMRSQDAIFGMGNDAPCFSFTHELMYVRLKEKFPDLKLGRYWHLADSFHVYERHFDMVQDILESPSVSKDHHGDCPPMSVGEYTFLVHAADKLKSLPDAPPFTRWLLDRADTKTLLETEHAH